MVNSKGGFGRPRSSDTIEHRLDWSSKSETPSSVTGPTHSSHRRHLPSSAEHGLKRRQQFDMPPDSLAYSHSASPTGSQLSSYQQNSGARYRAVNMPPMKIESDGFSMMNKLPFPPRSNASSANDAAASPSETAADPLLMPSPSMVQHATPPGQQIASSPMSSGPAARGEQGNNMYGQPYSTPTFGELQGMDFLQSLDSGTLGLDGAGDMNMSDNTMMNLGFEIGWDGLNHDFNAGQQGLDLFDGFFFGGQQGNGGLNGLGLNNFGAGGGSGGGSNNDENGTGDGPGPGPGRGA